MDTKLKEDIESIVSNIFSDKEQANQKLKTQEALNESAEALESLTQNLEDVKTELSTVKETSQEALAEKDSTLSNTVTELEAAQKELEEVKEALKASDESLENMKKDQIAKARMSELSELKVAMTSNQESQTAKVREMNDDDFDAYKVERVELRDAVKKELQAEAEKAAADVEENKTQEDVITDTTETDTEDVKTESGSEEEDTTTVPVNIAPGQAMAAAMNFETNPSDDMVEKYANLGKEMASLLTPKKSEK
jgi:chromosome segregation ATPase